MRQTQIIISIDEALTVVVGRQITSVSLESAKRKVEDALNQAVHFKYNPGQDIKTNLIKFYFDNGHTMLAEGAKNASEIAARPLRFGGPLNHKDIQRISKNYRLPMVLTVPIRPKEIVLGSYPNPIIVRKDNIGITRVYCSRCGRELNSTFSLETNDKFSYDACECGK